MDALTLINKSVEYEKLLEKLDFKSINSSDSYIRCACGLHGGNNPSAFVVNKSNNLWYCHTGGCGGGDIVKLVEKKFNIDFIEALHWITENFDIDISNMEIKERTLQQEDELKKFIKANKARKREKMNSIIIPEGKKLKSFRNFNESTVRKFELQYHESIEVQTNKGKPLELYKRILFPITFQGEKVGYTLRRTVSTHFPKWFYQPLNLETGDMIYNYDNIVSMTTVYVVEGIVDVMAFHEIGILAVSTFSSNMTEQQARLLLRANVDIVLAFDGDDAGRRATDKAIKLLQNKVNLFRIDFQEGEDPANISREELIKYVSSRKRI